ncbi:hypothetical protein [Dictyobacter formicarum]|uniref:DNA-directed RNA polymerase n=1 Tax=Dictyobacter formicarum TaxID=2778368 RepID=A0ABQ3VIF9_9CHLR|nr:hypothetical protein [Dictyobacter formicarum]GHO85603.1 hypothetical protein KSZ_36090 [Dictyobacter formicarum]
MSRELLADWHKATFEQCIHEWLPALLAERLPLVGYQVNSTGTYTYQMHLTLSSGHEEVTVTYQDLPQSDAEGVFVLDGERYVVVPYASGDDLAEADIFCVGEQLLHYCQQLLSYHVPDAVPWSEALVRAWLPIERWMREFFGVDKRQLSDLPSTAQRLDETNWLATRQHLFRLYVKDRTRLFTPAHFGRVCPFETPEGPNIGRIFPLVLGAAIRSGKLVVLDDRPAAMLGPEASMIPLLEHDHPRSLLMGANMLRQWLQPPQPEVALVQSGNEPVAPDFWCGRNFLTALTSWGVDTFDDGILLSASAARRLDYPRAVEPGDKLSNRHGIKGVVSRIVPDEQMPHLADGTPVELVYNVASLHVHQSFGVVWEAVLGRIAHAQGIPTVVPPFASPDEQSIRAALAASGLPKDGMETLTVGSAGEPVQQRCTVGWIYWGRLTHMAQEKLQAGLNPQRGQRRGELEYFALRNGGAFENIREQFHSCALAPQELADDSGSEVGQQAPALAPQFMSVARRLAAIGIHAELTAERRLVFRLAPPTGEVLQLARPVAHPWLKNQQLTSIGAYRVCHELAEYPALVAANTRLQRILASQAPESLARQALDQLTMHVHAFCRALITPTQLRFNAFTSSSSRAVVVPTLDIHYDQVGIPEEMAWFLFAPQLKRELDAAEVEQRSERASQLLDRLMEVAWVILNRAPVFDLRTFVACHPVRYPDAALHVHPLVSRQIQADFDGDQVAVFLPLSAGAQQEAGARLSVVAQLSHNPALIKALLPSHEIMWGLAHMSQTSEGRSELVTLLNPSLANVLSDIILTQAMLLEQLQMLLQQHGSERVVQTLERVWRRGFEQARLAGVSINPFIGSDVRQHRPPTDVRAKDWSHWLAEQAEYLGASVDYADPDQGTQLLTVKSGALGDIPHLLALYAGQETVSDVHGTPVAITHGYCDGLTAQELYAQAVGARQSFADVLQEWDMIGKQIQAQNRTKSYHVLGRAMCSSEPGMVFAHAALQREVDPLIDTDSRLFVGL